MPPSVNGAGWGGEVVEMEVYQPAWANSPSPNFSRHHSSSAPLLVVRYRRLMGSQRAKGAVSLMCRAPQPPGFSHRGRSGWVSAGSGVERA